MSVTIRDNRRGFDKLLADFATLAKTRVTIGIHGEEADREDGASNVLIGAVHEFGAPTHKPPIPQRAFLRPGVRAAQGEMVAVAKAGISALAAGTGKALAVAERMGSVAERFVIDRIERGIAPPLSARTIEQRLRRTKKGRAAVNAASRAMRSMFNGASFKTGFAKYKRKGEAFGKAKWVESGGSKRHQAAIAKVNAMAASLTPLHDSGQLLQSIRYKVQVAS